MPKLLAFVPCERVIISSDDNSASLITLFAGFKLAGEGLKQGTDESPRTLPIRWAAFALWYRLPEDEGQTYEQKVELVSPSGKVLISQSQEFLMVKTTHRNTGNVFGFPIVGTGEYTLRLFLRKITGGSEFRLLAEHPLAIDFETNQKSAASEGDRQQGTETHH